MSAACHVRAFDKFNRGKSSLPSNSFLTYWLQFSQSFGHACGSWSANAVFRGQWSCGCLEQVHALEACRTGVLTSLLVSSVVLIEHYTGLT